MLLRCPQTNRIARQLRCVLNPPTDFMQDICVRHHSAEVVPLRLDLGPRFMMYWTVLLYVEKHECQLLD
ncbi:hypothetical protein Poly59_22170 [Rubripirellula reticaptiva]|uniref:Uncharacterized protein n=1 Tax=Rubripirellula reticaptiva TaxID=2528013 RepID=A0A5C6F5W1_9BACT|nr:hypothetical protein Poly59_22170 [Rubripirellula reticaptiva]